MKKKETLQAQIVLEVVSVSAASHKNGEQTDLGAINFLQNAGFIALKAGVKSINARAPGGDASFLLVYEASLSNQKACKLVCFGPDVCREIETGYTIYIQDITGSTSDSIQVSLRGDHLVDWELVCKKVSKEMADAYKIKVAKGLLATDQQPEVEESTEDEVEPIPSPPPEDTPPPKPVVEKKIVQDPAPSIPVVEKVTEKQSDTSEELVLRIPLEECVYFQKQESAPAFSGQPRKHFNESDLQKLAGSLKKHGQKMPALVKRIDTIPGKKWEIIAGERRWRALKLIGCPFLRAIEEKPKNKKEQHLLSLIENLHRVDPSPLELSDALQEQIEAGETRVSLVEATSLSLSTVRKLLAIQAVHPQLKALLGPEVPEGDRIRLDEATVLAKIHPDHQVEIWNQAKDQPSRRLIVAKLNQLGKALFQSKRGPMGSRHNEPHEIGVRVNRRLNALRLAILELKAVTPEEWQQFATLRESQVPTEIDFMTTSGHDIEEIKQKICEAKGLGRTGTLAVPQNGQPRP